jgi:ABC-type nitrate/sulfonate/bicarbonate transport system ATPase subunit
VSRTGEVLLKVEDVGMTYGSNIILRDVNIEVRNLNKQGQIVCFLGPSGRGKTQLSRIIAGLQKPTSGTVQLRGSQQVTSGDVCMVPQNYPMFDYATVAQNLIIAGQQAKLSKADINLKATGYIEALELKDHLTKYPKELSGGTKQRVAIARQLMCSGHYMVMDEPFSGLDPVMKTRAQHAITTLAALDTYNTVIVVTHDVTEGLTIADTVWMLGHEPEKVGSTIQETFDLIEMDFAYRSDLERDSKFLQFVRDVKDRFSTL